MGLSSSLAKQFAKTITPKDTKKEETLKGTVKIVDNIKYVQLDGSDILTPVSTTVEIKNDERVKVLIKDHAATITDNLSSPMARTATVTDLAETVDQNGNSIRQLDNSITQQGNSIIQMNNSIQQQNDTINSFNNVIDLQNNAIQMHDTAIRSINSDINTINSSLTVQGSEISSLNDTVTSQGNNITSINNSITSINNTVNAQGNTINAQGNSIELFDSDIRILNTGFTIQDGVLTGLSGAVIDSLKTTTLDTDYAQIDFANIGIAAVEQLFADSGIIKDLTVQSGHITGELVGVTIKGDLIEGNTIVADKLVVLGSDGLYYKLNTNGQSVTSEQTQYNSLNGSIITAHTITADRVNVNDLVAFGATIGGFHITANSIYSGSKVDMSSNVPGLYIKSNGEFMLGDPSNHIKYYIDPFDQSWKLDIQSDRLIDLLRSASGNNSVTLNNCAEGPLQTLHLTGEMIPTFPHQNQYPSSALYPSTYPYLTVTYTKDNVQQEDKIRLPFDYLGKIGNVYDEFSLNNLGEAKLIRRIGLNEYGEQYELDDEEIIDCGLLVIPLHKGNNTISCIPYECSMEITYAISNEFTDIFATQLDLTSKIKQSASEIELSVNNNVQDATSSQNIISKINLIPGQILLEGTVTANGNFKILKDGSIEANNGKFTGDVYLGEGKKVIGGQGLFTNLQYTSTGMYSGWDTIGFVSSAGYGASTLIRKALAIDYYIPENFTATSAHLILQTSPINTIKIVSGVSQDAIGKCSNLKLYKGNNENTFTLFYASDSDYVGMSSEYNGTEIPKGLDPKRLSDTYTPDNISPGHIDTLEVDIDLENIVAQGRGQLFVKTINTVSSSDYSSANQNSGVGRLILNIFGYMSMEGE